jgi:D-alanyl-D-alanine carboxypeptidase/D-alanyl-D-alanine-endopeptidase (penicillin-binding protein 4)
MRRIALLSALILAIAPASAAADEALVKRLTRYMGGAGASSGAHVVNLTSGEVLFHWKQNRARILASNTKLFTTAAALARYGTEGTLGTEVRGAGELDEDGVWRGSLYLRGGGDPTFGTRTFARRSYGGGGSVERLVTLLQEAGIERVSGRIYGDESQFDSLRGGPDSRYGTSVWVGPLSALAFNRGLGNPSGSSFQVNPPAFAALQLDAALERRGINVRLRPRSGTAPAEGEILASVDSPPMERLIELTNKPSDNFFAEMLLKDLALQANGKGTTRGGAQLAASYARGLGSRARLVDGSGLSRGNRASPRQVVNLLAAMEDLDEQQYGDEYRDSLAVAGRDGTLASRMRSGPARSNCAGKTGTLSNVSALSGYCGTSSGELIAFSILMNNVYPGSARGLQDAMVQAVAALG